MVGVIADGGFGNYHATSVKIAEMSEICCEFTKYTHDSCFIDRTATQDAQAGRIHPARQATQR
ncbi:hypothetical protein [Niveispirillum sp. KHB5.9]|uniref:hypothetical protein n=1 Tax=Niveispirillum sp. KHB5.9 TaxID=3400269 RepID=UPI003A87BF1A